MRRTIIAGMLLLLTAGCAPVLDRELMDKGARDFRMSYLLETPEAFKGHLFILGGVIINARLSEQGSEIEALYIPVNAAGYLRDSTPYQGRFLAVYPRTKGLLDPMVYRKGRSVTLAGDYIGTKKSRIDELDYTYPVFEIREIYLWEEYRDYAWPYPYYYYPYYSPYYYGPYRYDPWWGRPYPYMYPW